MVAIQREPEHIGIMPLPSTPAETQDYPEKNASAVDIPTTTHASSENNLRLDLARFAIESQCSLQTLDKMLGLWNKYHPEDDLPRCAKTLLQTPRKSEVLDMPPGKYCHFGVEHGLIDYLNIKNGRSEQSIRIQIGIDGVPLFVSSNNGFWPILGRVLDEKNVFIIGCYFGPSKPPPNELLARLVGDLKSIIDNGFEYRFKRYTVRLASIICDVPAKSYVTMTKGHAGYNSCTKCKVTGESRGRRMCFPDLGALERTDSEYAQETDKSHQSGKSALLNIPDFGFVSNLPLDYMHCVLLGVTKRLVRLWSTNGPRKVRFLVGYNQLMMSKYINEIRPHIPREFSRKPRAIKDFAKWKATEFRLFLLYIGPFCLMTVLRTDDMTLQNFIVLQVAIRVLCMFDAPECVEYAGKLLKYFVRQFGAIYGTEFISYNVYSLSHFAKNAETYGLLDTFGAFIFENFLWKLKGWIRMAEKPLTV